MRVPVSPKDNLMIQVDKEFEERTGIMGYDGKEIIYLPDFRPGERVVTWGTIASTPKALSRFMFGPHDHELYRNITSEFRPGDKIYFHYLTIDPDNLVTGATGEKFYKLDVSAAYCVVRDGKIIPVGGHVFSKQVYPDDAEYDEELGYHVVRKNGIVAEIDIKPLPGKYKVTHIGDPLTTDDIDIRVGDIVQTQQKPPMGVPYQIEGEEYYIFRDVYILAKWRKSA